MAFPEKENEQVVLQEIKEAHNDVLRAPDDMTGESLQAYLDNSEKLALLEQRLIAKYTPRLYEVADDVIETQGKANPDFLHRLLAKFFRTSFRFHTFIGSGISEDGLNNHFGELSDLVGPAIAHQILQEIDEDVLLFVRESRNLPVKEIHTRLNAERDHMKQLMAKKL